MNQNFVFAALTLVIVVVSSVNTQLPSDDLQPHNEPNLRHQTALTRARRMYALCPPDFTKIANNCYFFSKSKESWLDSHFECKDRNSKLAEPLKFADRRLRKYLKNKDQLVDDKWIGGMYNWPQMKWKWGYNGNDMKYQSFANEDGPSDLRYHCTTMNPKVNYKWSAKVCTEQHYFICQHRMSFVNETNRQKIYSKWNETYPNQLANEVEVYVSTNGNSNRSLYRNVPKKNRSNPNKTVQLKNQIPKGEILPENAPEYLPYNVYSNLEQLRQKSQEDVIHPLRSPLVENLKKPSMKPRKRHSRPLKLTGEVNLGTNKFNNREKKLRQKGRKNQSEHPVNTIDETVTNAGRHHHHLNLQNEIKETNVETTTTTSITTDLIPTTTESIIIETTLSTADTSTLRTPEEKRKLDEKAHRRERLKAKLALLTPEEREVFLLMKAQRAEAKKRGINIGN